MKVLVFRRPDGGVSVVTPLGRRLGGEADAAYFARMAAKTVASGAVPDVPYRVVEDADLPPRAAATRDAWVDTGGAVVIDPARVRRRPRTVYALYQQVGALTAAQRTNVWDDLSAGGPPRWATDAGPNAAAIAALHWSAAHSGAAAANVNDARVRLAALYAQDNPGYLVNPAFDVSINVPGDEPDV